MSNKVLITNSQKAVKVPSGLRILIRRACNAVLEYEHFDRPAEISVTFVDNAAIAELNNQYRNKPMPTDVLSFPLGENGKYDIDENNGCMMLGDIVISMERAMEQANLYGHPLQREVEMCIRDRPQPDPCAGRGRYFAGHRYDPDREHHLRQKRIPGGELSVPVQDPCPQRYRPYPCGCLLYTSRLLQGSTMWMT